MTWWQRKQSIGKRRKHRHFESKSFLWTITVEKMIQNSDNEDSWDDDNNSDDDRTSIVTQVSITSDCFSEVSMFPAFTEVRRARNRLHNSMRMGSLSDIQRTLSEDSELLWQTDMNGRTPFHEACYRENVEAVQWILEELRNDKGPCNEAAISNILSMRDDTKQTALNIAYLTCNEQLIEVLEAHGAELTKTCMSRISQRYRGQPGIKKRLQNLDTLRDQGVNGFTILHLAAVYDNECLARDLVEMDRDLINCFSTARETPLMIAIIYGSENVVRFLLEMDSTRQLNAKNNMGDGIIHLAVKHNQKQILKILLTCFKDERLTSVNRNNTCLSIHYAVAQKDDELVNILLDHGTDIESRNIDGRTPFMLAIELGLEGVVKKMLEIDHYILYQNTPNHETTFDVAAKYGRLNIIKWLLINDISSSKTKRENLNAMIHYAAEEGHCEVVKYLIEEDIYTSVFKRNAVALHGVWDVLTNTTRDVATMILESKAWKTFLGKGCDVNSLVHKHGTNPLPLRFLIQKMPDVASVALTRCISFGEDVNDSDILEIGVENIAKGSKRTMDINCQFIEDSDIMCDRNTNRTMKEIKDDHPLAHLVRKRNKEGVDKLFEHPVVLALIRQKWNAFQWLYCVFILFYAIFVSSLTAYMSTVNVEEFDSSFNNSNCTLLTEINPASNIVKNLVYALCAIGITIEVIQALLQGSMYNGFTNFLDWLVYILAFLTVVDIPGMCRQPTNWQWQIGISSMLFSWLYGITFLRWLPGLGLYVNMIKIILKTFLEACIVFLLIILAFATSNYLLFRNQNSFGRFGYSFITTFVMVIGEFEHSDKLHGEDDVIRFRSLAFAVFAIFIVLAAIVVFNLMIALAVDDVANIRKRSQIEMYTLQIELTLSIEFALRNMFSRGNSLINCPKIITLRSPEDMNRRQRMWDKIMVHFAGPSMSENELRKECQRLREDQDKRIKRGSVNFGSGHPRNTLYTQSV